MDPRWAASKHMWPALSLADRTRGGQSVSHPRSRKPRRSATKSILQWRADGINFDAFLNLTSFHTTACTVNFAAGYAAVAASVELCRQLRRPLSDSSAETVRHRSLLLLVRIPRDCAISCESVCVLDDFRPCLAGSPVAEAAGLCWTVGCVTAGVRALI